MSAKRQMAPKILWITDPWTSLDHEKDTTLRFIEESVHQGVPAFWCDVRTLRVEHGETRADIFRITGVDRPRVPSAFERSARGVSSRITDYDQLHYRVDPPVDLAYIHPLHLLLLERSRGHRFEIVNPAESLLLAGEKTESLLFEKLAAPSLVSADCERLLRFVQHEGRVVLKPLHQAQSKGVELLDARGLRSSRSLRQITQTLLEQTHGGSRPILLQRYLAGIEEGETRLWFLDGKLLATVQKRPRKGTFRIDMDRGGSLAAHTLSTREKKAVDRIGRQLQTKGIRLAAVDLIEGLVTDTNFTSPGLLATMEPIVGENLARPVIEALAGKSRSRALAQKRKAPARL